jgi:hypothetical protein
MTRVSSFPSDAALRIAPKAMLAGEIVATYARVRWLIRRDPLPAVVGSLRGRPSARAGGGVETGRRLGHAVGRTLSVLPADSRCLMQSLVLTRLLARRGIESRLVIGVRAGDRFAAHAWVEHGDVPLLPAGSTFEQLVTL